MEKRISNFKNRKHSDATKAKMRERYYAAKETKYSEELELLKRENLVLKKVIAGLVTKLGGVNEHFNTSI